MVRNKLFQHNYKNENSIENKILELCKIRYK